MLIRAQYITDQSLMGTAGFPENQGKWIKERKSALDDSGIPQSLKKKRKWKKSKDFINSKCKLVDLEGLSDISANSADLDEENLGTEIKTAESEVMVVEGMPSPVVLPQQKPSNLEKILESSAKATDTIFNQFA